MLNESEWCIAYDMIMMTKMMCLVWLSQKCYQGLQMAFIDGNQTERLCEPMKQYIEKRGGQVLLNQPLESSLEIISEAKMVQKFQKWF